MENSNNNTGLVILLVVVQTLSLLTTFFVYGFVFIKYGSYLKNPPFSSGKSKMEVDRIASTQTTPTPNQFIPLSEQVKLEYGKGEFEKMQTNTLRLLEYAKTDEDKAIAYYWQGLANYGLKKYSESESFLKLSLTLKPNYAAAYVTLGAIALVQQDSKKMLDYSMKCVNLDPNYGWCHNNLGVAYLMMDQKDKGVEELRQAVKLDPTSYTFNDNLKRALAQ